jgi:FKBP-type peptidyl-prolyl cis-trans isomerase FkpA
MSLKITSTLLLLLFILPVVFANEKPPLEEVIYNTSEGMPDLSKYKLKTTPSGLQYIDLRHGEYMKQAGKGQTVVVHYTGWLLNGTKFDSSYDIDETFSFVVGSGSVIAGWDEGVSLMELGSKRLVVIPSNLGYGKKGSLQSKPPIPGKATLVFVIELLEIK